MWTYILITWNVVFLHLLGKIKVRQVSRHPLDGLHSSHILLRAWKVHEVEKEQKQHGRGKGKRREKKFLFVPLLFPSPPFFFFFFFFAPSSRKLSFICCASLERKQLLHRLPLEEAMATVSKTYRSISSWTSNAQFLTKSLLPGLELSLLFFLTSTRSLFSRFFIFYLFKNQHSQISIHSGCNIQYLLQNPLKVIGFPVHCDQRAHYAIILHLTVQLIRSCLIL